MRGKVWLSVVLIALFCLPMAVGAQSHYPGEVRRTIALQTPSVAITTSRYLELRCWLDPWEYLGCDPCCFNILVQSTVGNSTVTATCNDQLAYTFQVQAGNWQAFSLGDWNRYLHAGWNTIKVENKTRRAVAYVGRISLDLIPATWHDEIPQNDPPGLPLRSYRGLIHCHTNSYPKDDGSVALSFYASEGKKRGWDFVIPTGHNPTSVEQWARAQECDRLSVPGQFSLIPGAEISTTWKPSAFSKSYSHTLLLYYFGSVMMEQLQGKADYQQFVNRNANEKGALAVTAHPFLASDLIFKYNFSTAQATFATKGVECLNSLLGGQEEETFKKILEFVRNRQLIFVTSGSDYHAWFDPKGEERLQRLTEVFGYENTWAGIMRSLIYGRTCATAKGAYLEKASYLPYARAYYCSGTPSLSFDVRFAGKQKATVVYELYRDGKTTPIAKTNKKISGTDVLVTFESKDSSAPKGEHWYIMRVKDFIVTSPIIINKV